jgi:putative oxidoreductase
MKHIFFAFPAGAAGIALILLRLSAALWTAAVSVQLWSTSVLHAGLFFLLSFGLTVGFPTRLIAGGCAVGLAAWVGMIAGVATACVSGVIFDMVALALIGPGAYSVDAAIFGRRTIRLPE